MSFLEENMRETVAHFGEEGAYASEAAVALYPDAAQARAKREASGVGVVDQVC